MGSLDKSIVRRYIHRKLSKIRHCYEAELVHDPELSGTLSVSFEINARGKTSLDKSSGLHPKVDSCVANTLKTILFPKPTDRNVVSVTYSFTFTPK